MQECPVASHTFRLDHQDPAQMEQPYALYKRLFLRSTLRSVLMRIPDYRLPKDFEPRYQVGEARAMVSLPASFTPA